MSGSEDVVRRCPVEAIRVHRRAGRCEGVGQLHRRFGKHVLCQCLFGDAFGIGYSRYVAHESGSLVAGVSHDDVRRCFESSDHRIQFGNRCEGRLHDIGGPPAELDCGAAECVENAGEWRGPRISVEQSGKCFTVLDRGSLREIEVRPWGALQNCSMEKSSRVVTAQQIHNRMSAGRLPEHGDRVWVAAECLDVLAHPLERCDLIVDPEIAFADAVEEEVSEHADAVVDRHHHDVALG